ncbi:hypothetical protein [Endozoicomonas sp. YOMI1]|uniref:hypothetical protein n=1 Tax=Endozoicomonas sp. YOMI1 TaxID=2828739 RepID=UPI0021493CB8|nr:hypothetical protein [Endozoicomonas sp. YOMI1]
MFNGNIGRVKTIDIVVGELIIEYDGREVATRKSTSGLSFSGGGWRKAGSAY